MRRFSRSLIRQYCVVKIFFAIPCKAYLYNNLREDILKNSPHRNKHSKKKAIRDTNRVLETSDGVPIPEKKWPYHIEHEEDKHVTHHKKQSKNASPSDVDEQTEPAILQHENPKWNKVTQSQALDNTRRMNKKMTHQNEKEDHRGE
jgi:hypothetical protein